MGILEYIEKYFLDTSIFVSIQPIFYIISILTLFGFRMDWILGGISILSAFFVYTINKFTDMEEDLVNKPKRYLFHDKYKRIFYIAAILSYLLALYLSFRYNYFITLIVIIPLILGIAYSIKWIPKTISNYSRIKDIPGGKTLVLSFAWAISVSLICTYYVKLNYALFSLFIFIFLIEFIASLAFDVRDIRGDQKAGIKTIPIIIGKKNTMISLNILNILSLIFVIFTVSTGILPSLMIVVSIGIFLFYLICFWSMNSRIKSVIVYDMLLESVTIFFLIFTIIGINIFKVYFVFS